MSTVYDVIVVGAGMAGASLAAELADEARVLILEMEERPGYHTTGRSAATFIEAYGNGVINKLTRASRDFLAAPPPDFSERPFLIDRGCLSLATPGDEAALDPMLGSSDVNVEISAADALRLVPILREDRIGRAAYEAEAKEIDVDALHNAYLRLAKARGATLLCRAAVGALDRDDGLWQVTTPQGRFQAPSVINAAGAWADPLAELAGLQPLGLQPLRRSAALVVPPEGQEVMSWPIVGDVAETYYFLPMGGRLMVSPADETPVPPHDAFAEDLDVAQGIDHFEQAVTMSVNRVERTWAGLRTFAPDRTPVVGPDPAESGFFWFAGQGGYGIQTAPAMARLGAALWHGGPLPADLADAGVTAAELDPGRFPASATL